MLPSYRSAYFLTPLLAVLALSVALAADAPAPASAVPAAAASPAVSAPESAPAEDGAASDPAVPSKTAKAKKPKAAPAPAKGGAKSPASVVITVGPNKIRKRQIDTLVNLMARVKRTSAEMPPQEKQYLERMVASNLIGQELLDLEAKRLNVVADQKSIDSMSGVFKANFPNDEAFRRALKEAGDSEAGLREKMIRQIKADKLLSTQVTPVSRPTPKEMLDFFTANKAAFPINDSLRACQIVLFLDKNAASADVSKSKAELDQVRSVLAKDTAQLEALLTHFVMKAREVSDGPEKKDGGDLQRFLPGDFNPEFKKQVTALKVGQMSPVFRTPLGWHLILLTEKNDAKFESYQLQIARALMAQRSAVAGQALKKYLKTLSDRYKVSYLESGYKDTALAGVYER